MTIITANLSKTIAIALKPDDLSNKISLAKNTVPSNNSLGLSSDYKILGSNVILKDLKLFTAIKSLPIASMPDLQLTDSDTEKILKLIENENHSAKFQLEMYLGTGQDDIVIGSLSILNTQGYRYRYYNLLDTINGGLELSRNFELKICQKNIGYGYIKPTDIVNVIGYYIQEVVILAPDTVTAISGGNNNNNNNGGNTNNTTINWADLTQEQWLNLTQEQWLNQ